MKTTINPTTRATRRYIVEFRILMTAYAAVCVFWIFHGGSGRWRIALPLLAIIPLLFACAAYIRFILCTDELDRKMRVESLAIAGGTTVLIAQMYALLELFAGFPKQHAIWICLPYTICSLIAGFFVRRRYK